ncbi:MAG: amylo-alpha-1,6-glucosidase [Synergistaceae bacterium]|jgi:predicted glycogen debranching enzyme|nr:amylo-alpha-1,6-glucosidase [Synergistaceae bacterium]
MYLGKADVNTYDKGVEREFLVSNGTGNYGSSTVIGANTRGEHGLLVVRREDSTERTVLASKLEETLYAHNKKYQLSTNRYKDLVYPDGYRYLQEYQGTPFPSMLFVIHSIFLKKSIFMPQSGTSTIVKYELLAAPGEVGMDIRPLFAHRAIGDVSGSALKPAFDSSYSEEGVVGVSGRGHISHISFTASGDMTSQWSQKPLWYENVVYEKDEKTEGLSADYLWSPGYGSIKLRSGCVLYVVLSEEPVSYSLEEIKLLENETVERTAEFVRGAAIDSPYSGVQDMIQSSSHLVTDRKGASPAIFSGFPSVEQRARDTFISLPGLTLATGRTETARGILNRWLGLANAAGGIMPARVTHNGEPSFGDIDAGLWFIYAVDKFSRHVGYEYARLNYKKIEEVIERYFDGPEKLGAVMDSESKLIKYLGTPGTNHWMSGETDGEPLVTRKGYLVEVNSLWYNALSFMSGAAKLSGDSDAAEKYEKLASGCRASFEKVFWNKEKKYLFDWVDPTDGEYDDAIRPNAILSVSLPYPALSDELGRELFATSWDELYTTYGLRTLDPHHEKFKGRAEGRPDQKKKARLRGMAWPWLLGQFITAYMRFNPGSFEMGWSFVRPFTSHLRRGCLGGVAEYFDGMMPYIPNGDVLSAMSLGELLRVIDEDLKSS